MIIWEWVPAFLCWIDELFPIKLESPQIDVSDFYSYADRWEKWSDRISSDFSSFSDDVDDFLGNSDEESSLVRTPVTTITDADTDRLLDIYTDTSSTYNVLVGSQFQTHKIYTTAVSSVVIQDASGSILDDDYSR